MTRYALLENGSVHTDDLRLADALEMFERHSRIFDTIKWEVVPMGDTKGKEKLIGILERHRKSAVRYNQP